MKVIELCIGYRMTKILCHVCNSASGNNHEDLLERRRNDLAKAIYTYSVARSLIPRGALSIKPNWPDTNEGEVI